MDTAGRNIDEAHRDFQRSVKPAADFVDEKTNTAVGEGKKAARKVTGSDEEDPEPDPK